MPHYAVLIIQFTDGHFTKRVGRLRNSRAKVTVRNGHFLELLERNGPHLSKKGRYLNENVRARRRRRQVTDESSASTRREENLLKLLTDHTSPLSTNQELDHTSPLSTNEELDLDNLRLQIQLKEMTSQHESSKMATDLNQLTEIRDQNVKTGTEEEEGILNDLDKQLENLKLTSGLVDALEDTMDLVPKFMLPGTEENHADDENTTNLPIDVMDISGDGSGSGETIIPTVEGSGSGEDIISFTKLDHGFLNEYEGYMKDLEIQLLVEYEGQKRNQEEEKEKEEEEKEEEEEEEEEEDEDEGEEEVEEEVEEEAEREQSQNENEQREISDDRPGYQEEGDEQKTDEDKTEEEEVKGQVEEETSGTGGIDNIEKQLETLRGGDEDRPEESENTPGDEAKYDDTKSRDNEALPVLSRCVSPGGFRVKLLPEDLCDGNKDCINGEDERKARCQNKCPVGYRKCADGFQCLKEKLFCNGFLQCRDQSDELNCGRTRAECEEFEMFSCDGVCRLKSFLCDHTQDCKDGVDEIGCKYGGFYSLPSVP
ncbi:putative low-density lipoprotein receptor class A domain-containing protein 3 [Apostichopus japonicus]|uniref:Putative low-density lipoprotein receptor class A domain-containing protein 3 n=1 Tax=Stichopus japonicus TaxID=307972 RepID=A0A2G8KXA0_STIJA|nr:putative low-density lipoprotein receptor class A domain-containing protein 3 [Apostichopus japonicus]